MITTQPGAGVVQGTAVPHPHDHLPQLPPHTVKPPAVRRHGGGRTSSVHGGRPRTAKSAETGRTAWSCAVCLAQHVESARNQDATLRVVPVNRL